MSDAQNRTAQADNRQQQKPLVPSPDCIAATRELAWDFGREQLGIERLALVAAPHFPIEGEAEASIEDAQGAITSHGFTESYDERYWYWLGLSEEIGVGHLAISVTGDLELACAGRFDCTGLQENYAGSLTSKVPSACGEAESPTQELRDTPRASPIVR